MKCIILDTVLCNKIYSTKFHEFAKLSKHRKLGTVYVYNFHNADIRISFLIKIVHNVYVIQYYKI